MSNPSHVRIKISGELDIPTDVINVVDYLTKYKAELPLLALRIEDQLARVVRENGGLVLILTSAELIKT